MPESMIAAKTKHGISRCGKALEKLMSSKVVKLKFRKALLWHKKPCSEYLFSACIVQKVPNRDDQDYKNGTQKEFSFSGNLSN
jgi:hypothetical protein